MPWHFLYFRRSAITKINFRVASLGNIKIVPACEDVFLCENYHVKPSLLRNFLSSSSGTMGADAPEGIA